MKDWLKFCEDCGQCCGLFPLPAKLFFRHQTKAQRPYTILDDIDEHIVAVTEDGFCIFLNDKWRCVIYDSRPELCRLYGTIPALQCTRLRGEADDFVGEAISAAEHAALYGVSPLG